MLPKGILSRAHTVGIIYRHIAVFFLFDDRDVIIMAADDMSLPVFKC